jgi:hypothetical protein
MTKKVGVACRLCGKFIALGEMDGDTGGTVYVPDLEPTPCRTCGGSYVYVSDDVVDEAGEKLSPAV